MSHVMSHRATRSPRLAPPPTTQRTGDSWRSIDRDMVVRGLHVVLPLWIASRAVGIIALGIARSDTPAPGASWLDTYATFDVGWFLQIADRGYADKAVDNLGSAAFMPLMPGIMRYGGALLGDRPIVAGLITANLGAFVAAMALYVLARMGLRKDRPLSHGAAALAVAFFLLSPMALPLFIAYSEPLLLALVLPAWIAARRNLWWLAGALASVAVLARISGLFFAFGLGVMFLTAMWDQSSGKALGTRLRAVLSPGLVPMVLPLAVYAGWQYRLYLDTGIPNAAANAQAKVWGRSIEPPWVGLTETWANYQKWHHTMTPWEVLGLVAILALAVVVTRLRMWPELALVASSAAVLLCSSLWGSCLRGLEILFPFWLLVGMYADRLRQRRGGDEWIVCALVVSTLGLFWTGWSMFSGVLVI